MNIFLKGIVIFIIIFYYVLFFQSLFIVAIVFLNATIDDMRLIAKKRIWSIQPCIYILNYVKIFN